MQWDLQISSSYYYVREKSCEPLLSRVLKTCLASTAGIMSESDPGNLLVRELPRE